MLGNACHGKVSCGWNSATKLLELPEWVRESHGLLVLLTIVHDKGHLLENWPVVQEPGVENLPVPQMSGAGKCCKEPAEITSEPEKRSPFLLQHPVLTDLSMVNT